MLMCIIKNVSFFTILPQKNKKQGHFEIKQVLHQRKCTKCSFALWDCTNLCWILGLHLCLDMFTHRWSGSLAMSESLLEPQRKLFTTCRSNYFYCHLILEQLCRNIRAKLLLIPLVSLNDLQSQMHPAPPESETWVNIPSGFKLMERHVSCN